MFFRARRNVLTSCELRVKFCGPKPQFCTAMRHTPAVSDDEQIEIWFRLEFRLLR